MSKVVHFEINTPDVDKATAFYSGVFGWEFSKWENDDINYWLINTGDPEKPGIGGGMMSMDDWPATVNLMEVDSVDAATEKITAHGGKVVVPKMAIPGVGYSAYFKDSCGIAFGIYQPDPTAA